MGTVPTLISGGNLNQFPLKAAGVLGGGSSQPFMVAASFQVGSGGLPAVGRIIPSGAGQATGYHTQVAFPGFGATLVGTGVYAITHPPAQNAIWWPNISTPSGVFFQVTQQYKRGDSVSGLAFFQVGQSNSPTGIPVPQNLPTGTRVDLLGWISPRNDQNITRF